MEHTRFLVRAGLFIQCITISISLLLGPAACNHLSLSQTNGVRERPTGACVHKLIDTIGESKEGVATSPQ